MKIKVYSLEGEAIDEMELPEIFNEEFRPDVIKRAVLSAQTARVQPWGPDPMAGKRTSAQSYGAGRGVAMVPRIKNGSRAAFVPQAVGGRRA
ncbi:MAG: 50S ribosomal protein L4, partial [Methanothermobacter sp.]|nr:50S ribosomal protein L4 [Methanothermobacter sp.]